MPVKKFAIKALKNSKKRAVQNSAVKKNIKELLKNTRKAVSAKEQGKVDELVKQTIRAVDRAAAKGIMKKNTAARKKSRIIKAVRAGGMKYA